MVRPAPKMRLKPLLDRLSQWQRLTWTIIQGTLTHSKEAQLPMAASSLSYTTILSLIPLLALSFSVFHAFGGIERLLNIVEPFILSNLAEGADEQALATIRNLVGRANAGIIGAGGFFGLIFTSMSMLSSAEGAIQRAWHSKIERPLHHRIAFYWLFITLGPLAAAVALGFAESTQASIKDYLPSGTGVAAMSFLFFLFIYKFVPTRKVALSSAALGACFTTLGIALARGAYSLYTQRVVSYHTLYGSLGAIPILLLWIYIVWLIILTGAALTAVLQRRLS